MTGCAREDDGDDYRFPALFAAFETSHYPLTWLTPGELLAIACDLCEADERDGDPEAVLRAWLELGGDPS